MDIMYTINHDYAEICAASMLSVIMNNPTSLIRFHVVTLGFTENDYKLFENIKSFSENIYIIFYKLEDYNINDFGIPNWNGNQVANARLFFQDIIDTSRLDKLLYLDADTIIVNKLNSILEYNGTVNAVEETIHKNLISHLGLDRYFNSGVLLIDVEKWIEADYQRRIIEFRSKNPNIPLTYPDQDLINLAIGFEINPLPLRYNMRPYALVDGFNKKFYNDKRKYNSGIDLETEINNAVIYHSYGGNGLKPWRKNRVNPINKEFDKYARIINPEFKKENIPGLRRIIANHPSIYYSIVNLKDNKLPVKSLELK